MYIPPGVKTSASFTYVGPYPGDTSKELYQCNVCGALVFWGSAKDQHQAFHEDVKRFAMDVGSTADMHQVDIITLTSDIQKLSPTIAAFARATSVNELIELLEQLDSTRRPT